MMPIIRFFCDMDRLSFLFIL